MKLEPPAHIRLRRYRTTPHHLESFQAELQTLLLRVGDEMQRMADAGSNTLEKVYSQGFEDGYAAALLELEKSGG